MINSNMKPTIVRKGHLAKKIVIVDGQPGCGKTVLSPIISSMDRVELLSYSFEIEFICRLFHLQKIEQDAAVAMVKMLTDHKLYQTMMGRDTNFRYSDLSSVFYDSSPWRYFMRIFQEGDMAIPGRINKQRPILNLTTHDLLGFSEPIFRGLGERVVLIEVIRHPLYMLIQQTLNFERLLDNPRDIQVSIKYGKSQLPYFANGWEEIFEKSNLVEKSIYSIARCKELTDLMRTKLKDNYGKQIITIPFESFVLKPWPYIRKIETVLESRITHKTKKVMKKQKVPRKKISDSISLAIYKRCGWEPPEKNLTEQQELDKRRQFAIDNGASRDALETLDKLRNDYEKNYFSFEEI